MGRAARRAQATIRQVGRRVEATNLLPGWQPAEALRAAGMPVDVVTETTEIGTRITLLFKDPRVAKRVFAALLNDGAYGLDPYLPNDHTFTSAALSNLAG